MYMCVCTCANIIVCTYTHEYIPTHGILPPKAGIVGGHVTQMDESCPTNEAVMSVVGAGIVGGHVTQIDESCVPRERFMSSN